jgi:hypothetical protein
MLKRLISFFNDFLPIMVSLLLILFVIASSMSGIFDTDIWLHLKTGKLILSGFKVPTADPYSFTTSGKPWINHEWLFQVVAYLTYRSGGVDGLVFLQTLLIALAFFVLFLIGFRDNKHLFTTTVISILAIYATHSRFNLRPDVLSLIFFGIFLHQLTFARGGPILYLLALWQLVWVNCHGYFFLGPLLILLFISAELIRRYLPHLPGDWSKTGACDDATLQRLTRVFFLVFLVCFLNPQFIVGALYPIRILVDVLSGKASHAFQHVQELTNALPFKGNTFGGDKQLYILISAALFSLIVRWRTLNIVHILLYVLFVPFGLLALRNVGFLSFTMYFILVSRLDALEATAKKKIKIGISSKAIDILAKIFVAMVFIWYLGKAGYSQIFSRYYDFDTYQMKSMLQDTIGYRYPKKCVDFIMKNRLPGNLFNDFNSGAYLIYHAYPQYKVFIDGRTELYPKDFFTTYFSIILEGKKKTFAEQVEKFNINTVMLNNSTAHIPPSIFKMLYTHPQWQLVFFDEAGVVFLKKTASNSQLLKTLSIDLKKWQAPRVDLARMSLGRVAPDPYIERARLLDLVNLDAPLASEAQEALRISPSSGEAQFYLAKTLYNQNKILEAFEHFRLAYSYGFRKYGIAMYLAKCYWKLSNKERTLEFFKKALKDKASQDSVAELLNLMGKEAVRK